MDQKPIIGFWSILFFKTMMWKIAECFISWGRFWKILCLCDRGRENYPTSTERTAMTVALLIDDQNHCTLTADIVMWYNSLWIWRWLVPHRFWKCVSHCPQHSWPGLHTPGQSHFTYYELTPGFKTFHCFRDSQQLL